MLGVPAFSPFFIPSMFGVGRSMLDVRFPCISPFRPYIPGCLTAVPLVGATVPGKSQQEFRR
jgi:hypothetical protein